jgi:hypothetical protein
MSGNTFHQATLWGATNLERDQMAVRIALSRWTDDFPSGATNEPVAETGRRSFSSALRSRFGFSLLQAPLLKPASVWFEELDVPMQRSQPVSEPAAPPA